VHPCAHDCAYLNTPSVLRDLNTFLNHILHAPAMPQHLTGHLTLPQCSFGATLPNYMLLKYYVLTLHCLLCLATVLCATTVPCNTVVLKTMHQYCSLCCVISCCATLQDTFFMSRQIAAVLPRKLVHPKPLLLHSPVQVLKPVLAVICRR